MTAPKKKSWKIGFLGGDPPHLETPNLPRWERHARGYSVAYFRLRQANKTREIVVTFSF